MPDQDISKYRTFQNWQVIALLSVTISITSFATGVIYQIQENAADIMYEHKRVDRKTNQLQQQINELKEEIDVLNSK